MNPKNLIRNVLLVAVAGSVAFFVTQQMRQGRAETADVALTAVADAETTQSAGTKVVMTYFTTHVRCTSCRKIEALTRENAELRHADALADGRLVFRVINTDDPGMGGYVDQYQLTSKTVILSHLEDGREVEWKNMNDVWRYFGEPEVFHAYLGQQIDDWAGQ